MLVACTPPTWVSQWQAREVCEWDARPNPARWLWPGWDWSGEQGYSKTLLKLKKKKKKSPDLWAWMDGSLSVRAVEVEAEEAFGTRLQSHMTYGGWGRVDN